MERVLETSAAGIFSPGNRYISSMYPKFLYAGLPRSFWKKLHYYGLLEEIDLTGDQNNSQIIANDDEGILSAAFTLDTNKLSIDNMNKNINEDFTIGDNFEDVNNFTNILDNHQNNNSLTASRQ